MAHNQPGFVKPNGMFTLLWVLALIFTSLSLNQALPVQAATHVVVTPITPNGWGFLHENTAGGIGEFVDGPATPALGDGSANMQIAAGQGEILGTLAYTGTPLDTITKLNYSSYRSSVDSSDTLAIALQLNIDYDLTDAIIGWQGRLVYEPYQSPGNTVPENQWQSWDALAGQWWFSAPQGAGATFCPQSEPCSWDYIITTWPQIGIHADTLLGGVLFKAGSWGQDFDGNVDAFTIGISSVDTTYNFENELNCTNACYVNASTGDDSYGGASPERAKKTIQAGLDQVAASGTVHVAAGEYAEALSITKNGISLLGAGAGTNPLQHTILKGPVASASGIVLPNSGTTGVSIKNLRVIGFNNGGICSTGSNNNNLSIDTVHVVANTAGTCLGGIYINGPVSDVNISNVLADQNTSRGIVIWNGLKQRITISNNTVTRNNCCGIELQDGTASGVTITNNTITNNTDNGIGLVGLMAGAGPNLISKNILINNGRFGIELKLPNGSGAESGDGSIMLRDNTVALADPIDTLRPTEERDLGGIVVIRRGYVVGNNNIDIPTGVVIKNNTVNGYKQNNLSSDSEGFGIVVEGYLMSVYGNTLNANDIGIQRQAGHLPYTANAAVDGNQADLADNYFGRGNSPHTCALIGTNTFSMNGADTRDVNPDCDIVASLRFSIQPGNGQAGSPLSPQPIIEVLDAQGNLDTSYNGPVMLVIGNNPAAGTLAGDTIVSAVNGVASFSNISINKVGTGYTLLAYSDSLASVASTGFDISHGPATHVMFTTQPGNGQVGQPLNPAPVVTLLDAYDNIVSDYSSSVLLTLAINPGSATLSGDVSVNAVNGVATFNNIVLDREGQGYKLTAWATELTTATSNAFDISPRVATQLSFSTQPGGASIDNALNPQPVVSVLDAQGSIVTSYTGAITLTLGTNPGSGILTGTITLNAVNGVASFSDLSINKAGTGYRLLASAAGLSSTTSAAFNITASIATQLRFSIQPGSATEGSPLNPQPVVQVLDAQGNLVSSYTGAVTLVLGNNPGNASLNGTITVNAVNGVANFSGLSISKSGLDYTLVASASALNKATSLPFDVIAQTALSNKLYLPIVRK